MPVASPPGAPRKGFKKFVRDDVDHRRQRCLGPMTWERWQQERTNFSTEDQEMIDDMFETLRARAK